MVEAFIGVLCEVLFAPGEEREVCQSLIDWCKVPVKPLKVKRVMNAR